VKIYRSALRKLLHFVGDSPLSAISPRHADLFKVERLKEASAVTTNIDLRTLRAAFNAALRWELIDHNPFARIQQVKPPEGSPSFFTKTDFEKLINLVKENWLKEIIVLAVLTGMRRGEIVNLRWKDVDLARKVVHIRSSSSFRTKLGKQRMIPLSDVAAELLEARHARSTKEFVFTLNGRRIREGWVSHKFKYYVYEARFPDDRLHFHSLRHTFASWLVQDGVSLYEVQKLLGHSSIAVTQVYSHLQPEQLHDTVNRLKIGLN
jgi:integrase